MRDEGKVCLIGGILSVWLSLSAVTCMITGFQLPIEYPLLLTVTCVIFGAGSALCFCRKRGGSALVCLIVVLLVLLWIAELKTEQFRALIHRISYVYDCAYGWGVLRLVSTWRIPADIPMNFLGALIALGVSWTVCCRKSAALAVGLAVLPLVSCLVVTDTVPGTWCLILLMAGLIVLMMTNSLRRREPAQSNRLTALVILPVIAAVCLLFLAVPQETYTIRADTWRGKLLNWVQSLSDSWDSGRDEGVGEWGTGGNDIPDDSVQGSVKLKTLGSRPEYIYPLMNVTSAQTGVLYLREQGYDLYTGEEWSVSKSEEQMVISGQPMDIQTAGDVTVRTLDRRDALLLPYYPSADILLTNGRAENRESLREYAVSQSVLPENWREFVARSETEVFDASLFAGGEVWSSAVIRPYQALPEDTRNGAEIWLDAILTDEQSATEKADAIARFVQQSAQYDENPARMPTGETDFALWFLAQSDTGYCVHFATATAVLLRAAGVDARYVTGYMVQGIEGEPVTVTTEAAHAWVEYYEPRLGIWVPLESTPSHGTVGGDDPAGESTTPTQQSPTEPETNPAETGTTALPLGGENDPVYSQPMHIRLWALLKSLLVLGAVLLTVEVQRRVRLRRRERVYGSSANAQALARWREAVLLSDHLKQKPPEELLALAEKAKYSQYILTEEELHCFDEYLNAARQRCRKKRWYQQLIDRYIFAAY